VIACEAIEESSDQAWVRPGRDFARISVAMPEPAFTAEPLRAGLIGDELRQTTWVPPRRP
jgi:hypothetical protein